MDTLTLELPQTLAQQVQARGISKEYLNGMFINLVQICLQESDRAKPARQEKTSLESAWPDPAEFTRRLIANNKELFEELARL